MSIDTSINPAKRLSDRVLAATHWAFLFLLMATGSVASLATVQSESANLQIPAAQRAYDEGVKLESQGHHLDACGKFSRAIEINPEFSDAYYHLGTSELRAGNAQAAIKAFIQLIQLEPQNQKAILAAADIYRDLQLNEDALALYTRAEHFDPKSAVVHYDLGCVLFQDKRYGEAITELNTSLFLNSHDVTARRLIASAYLGAGDTAAAEKELEDALAQDPNQAGFHLDLGRVLLQERRVADAENQYRAVLVLEPRNSLAHVALAGLLRRTGRASLALDEVGTALQSDPNSAAAFLEKGQCEYTLGLLEEAAQDFDHFSRLEPGRPDGHYLLGLLEIQRLRFSSAIENLQDAVKIDPNLKEAYYYMAEAYYKSGNYVQAKKALAECLNIDPTDQKATALQAQVTRGEAAHRSALPQ
jgi:tetratricopeptide (TPR) repeat protein